MNEYRIRKLVVLMTDAHHFAMVSRELERRGSAAAAAEGIADGAEIPLARFIQAYYEMVGEAVVRFGGRVLKYIGDGSLSVFEEGAALEAIRCGFELRAGYARIAASADLGIETDLEVGLSYGPVVEGIFGHESARGYDVFGEAVDEAAMITHHRGIAVAEPLRALLAGRVRLEKLEDRVLKWRTEPLPVWEAKEG